MKLRTRNNARSIRHGLFAVVLALSLLMSYGLTSNTVFAGETDSESVQETAASSRTEVFSPANLCQEGYDIIFVIDNSRSVWSLQKVRNQAFKNISNLAVGSNNRIGAVYFADHAYQFLSLTSMKEKDDIERVLSFLSNREQDDNNADTNIGNALETARSMLDSQDPSRQKIVILFSDGINENTKDQASYKEAADKKTKKEAKKLKEMKIPLYCVYLQKNRNDENFLHELVNYFDGGDDLTKERFAKVKVEDISALSPTFADVFYRAQNNMKYLQIDKDSLDVSGSKSFYIPSMGIRRVNAYIEEDADDVKFHCPESCDPEIWTDGTATFMTCENPAGEWSITAEDADSGTFFGAVSCYVNLSSDMEIVNEGGGNKRALLHYYDENGSEIALDKNAHITLESIRASDGKATSIPVTVTDGKAKSKAFSFEEYGEYVFRQNLTYKDSQADFVDLAYEITYNNENLPPVPHPISETACKGAYSSEEDMVCFTLDIRDLFTDPEGDPLKIVDIAQLNPDNPVTLEQRGETLYAAAPKAGNIAVRLTAEDKGGARSDLEIETKLRDTVGEQKMIRNISIIAILLLILLIFWKWRKKKKTRDVERFEEELSRKYVNDHEELCSTDQECNKKLKTFEKKWEELKATETELTGVIYFIHKLSDNMPRDLCEIVGVDDYLSDDFCKRQFEKADQIRKSIDDIKTKKERLCTEVDKHYEHFSEPGEKIDKQAQQYMEGMLREMEKYKTDISSKTEELKTEAAVISETIGSIKKNNNLAFLKKRIKAALQITKISGLPGKMLYVSDKAGDGKNRTGYYQLDGMPFLGERQTLESSGLRTGIYIIGYNGDDGNGLTLLSKEPFILIKKTSEGEKSRKETTKADIPVGESCELTKKLPDRTVTMHIEIM